MNKDIKFNLSILLLQEDGIWVAQCLQKDIASQGSTIENAISSFERTFVGQVILDLKDNKSPLEDIQQAPNRFFETFNKLENQRLMTKRPIHLPITTDFPQAFVVDAMADDFRISA